MAKVINQGIKPLNNEFDNYLPNLGSLQCGTPYAKKLGALPAYLSSQLAIIASKTSCKIEDDGYGWSFPVTENGERLSLAISIVNGSSTCTYERGHSDVDQVNNEGIDAIGSRGYAINGLYDKVPAEFWSIQIKSAEFATHYAWEETDGNGDYKKVIMPIILITLEENPMCMIKSTEIQKPTAKMQAVLKDIN